MVDIEPDWPNVLIFQINEELKIERAKKLNFFNESSPIKGSYLVSIQGLTLGIKSQIVAPLP